MGDEEDTTFPAWPRLWRNINIITGDLPCLKVQSCEPLKNQLRVSIQRIEGAISMDIGVKTQVNTNRRHRNRQQQSDLWAVWILWMDLDLAQEKTCAGQAGSR